MTDPIPKQVHPLIRETIKQLDDGWEVVKKRDHYFLHHNGRRVVCIGNNSSKPNAIKQRKPCTHCSDIWRTPMDLITLDYRHVDCL